jgi:uncharacterized coiled-coil protein SlyX
MKTEIEQVLSRFNELISETEQHVEAIGAQMDIMQQELNSINPINTSYQAYKDRSDVNKAFSEWAGLVHEVYPYPAKMKEFAVFFAERVKGGKL